MKILNNYVLVMPDYEDFESCNIGTQRMKLNTTYEKQKHSPSSGVVLAVCESLRYAESDLETDKLLFDTDMEIQVDDHVIFHYNALPMAIKAKKCIGDAILVRYDQIYAGVRGNSVFVVNGVVIVEAKPVEQNSPILTPVKKSSKPALQQGVIRSVGTKNRKYRFNPEASFDHHTFLPGDEVLFPKQHSIPLQYNLHSIIDPQASLYRMYQKDIAALYRKEIAA